MPSICIKKVLVSDNVDKQCKELLERHGISVTFKTNLKTDDLIQELQDCEGLIVRSETKVTKGIMDACKSLKVIGRAGVGVDNIDVQAATENGIIVLKNVTTACQSMKEGKWARKSFAGGSELAGKTLAVIGLGRIGKEVALRMKSYGMNIIGYDPFVDAKEALVYSVKKLNLEEIWPIADYITIHTPLIPQTKNLFNDEVFSKCKNGMKIVNAARGGIINEESLLKALENGKCGGAALDVFSEEPPTSDLLGKLISHPNVIATPHIGASTSEAQIRVAAEVAEQFIALNDPDSEYKICGIVNAPEKIG